VILDCDLLVGRDLDTARRQRPADLADTLRDAGIDGGAVASLRALSFHAPSGNQEAREAAVAHGWLPVVAVDLRDPLGAEAELLAAREAGVRLVRLAPERQGIPPAAPRVRLLARIAAENGATILVEGALPGVAPAFVGLGANVVFLDQHFYDLGEFILLSREEPGFHASTRLLGAPGAWETVLDHAGVERLVFGARSGWYEVSSVLERFDALGLDDDERALVGHGNLERLAGPR
jgi:predicted TIM-barrel fold metal-dependent hydrolase